MKDSYDPAQGYGVGFYGDRADTLFAQWLTGYLKASVWEALNAAHRQHPEWNRRDMEDFRKAMAARLSSRMRDLRRERDAEFAAAATSQGPGTALVLVTDKLAKRDAEFGSPKYKHSRITVRDQMAAHKGSLAGDQVGFGNQSGAARDRRAGEGIRVRGVFRWARQTREKSALAGRRSRGVGEGNHSDPIGRHSMPEGKNRSCRLF